MLLSRRCVCRRRSFDAQSERAADARRTVLVFGGNDQGGVGIAREAREAHGDLSREWRRAVEDDEPERATPQQHVRAPGARGRRPGAHHGDTVRRGAKVRPVARRERAARIDVCDPRALRDGVLDERAEERRPPAAARAEELGEPAARHAARRERRIERVDPRGQPRALRCGGAEHLGELLLERSERRGHVVSVMECRALHDLAGSAESRPLPNKYRNRMTQTRAARKAAERGGRIPAAAE